MAVFFFRFNFNDSRYVSKFHLEPTCMSSRNALSGHHLYWRWDDLRTRGCKLNFKRAGVLKNYN